MDEEAGAHPREEELQDGAAHHQVQVERPVHELELRGAARQQPFHRRQKLLQRELPHRDVQRRQAELARERAAARRLHVNHAVREVVGCVEVVGQRDVLQLGQLGGDDFRKGLRDRWVFSCS